MAARVIAIAGRFAEPLRRTPKDVRFHLIHGEQDNVVPSRWSVEAADALRLRGVHVTLELIPGLGHGIDDRVLRLAMAHLGDERV